MSESGSAVMGGNTADDVEQLLALYGMGGVGVDLRKVKPFRMTTVQEAVLTRAVLMRQGALGLEQFAENPWGFPPIPFPANRNRVDDRRLLLAPSGISYAWMGHPIFWIDPELSAPTESELAAPARWGVRMFYLIMAFGLWDVREGTDTPLAWFDAPATRGVQPSEADYRAYCAGQPSVLDTVRFGASDLHVSIDDINLQAQSALARVEVLQARQWTRMRQEQKLALSDAKALLATSDTAGGAPTSEHAEVWPRVSARLRDLSGELAKRVYASGVVHDLVDPVYDAIGELVDLLNRMERTSLVLSSSVLHEVAAEPSTYASVATELEMYAARLTNGLFESDLNKVANEIFDATVADARSFARLYERAEQLYQDCWRRLKLAEINLDRISRGESPYADYAQYQLLVSLEPEVGQRLDSMEDLQALRAPEPVPLDDGSAYDDRHFDHRRPSGG